MSDLFNILPADLFLDVIFPQIYIGDLMRLKSVSKQFKHLIEEYQDLYKGYICVKYKYVPKVNEYIPNSHITIMLSTKDLDEPIEPYPVVKTIFISYYINRYDSHFRMTLPQNGYPKAAQLPNPDLSKFTQLEDLTILCVLGRDNLSNLSTLTNLKHLCIINSHNASDLSALSNLRRFKIVNCPNITKLPPHLKLRRYHELGESITATEQYSVMEDVD